MTEKELTARLYLQEPVLRSYLMFCGVKSDDVDEVLQDVMVTAWRKYGSLREPDLFPAWIKRIAQRKASKYVRKMEGYWRRNYPLSNLEAEREAAGLPVPEELIYRELEKFTESELYQLVQNLGDPAANILILHYVYRETYDEIAHTLHMKPATVRSIASRSREKLKKRIQERRDMPYGKRL